jgi:hypothetical protein
VFSVFRIIYHYAMSPKVASLGKRATQKGRGNFAMFIPGRGLDVVEQTLHDVLDEASVI